MKPSLPPPQSLNSLWQELSGHPTRRRERSDARPSYRIDSEKNPWHNAAAYKGGSKRCDCGGWVECTFQQGRLAAIVLIHKFGCQRGREHALGVEVLSIPEWNASIDRRPNFSIAKNERPKRLEEPEVVRPFKRKKDRLERHRRH